MDKTNISNDVLENLSWWTLLDPDLIREDLIKSQWIKRIDGLLDTRVISPFEAVCRRILHKILLYSSDTNRYRITDSIKKLRQLVRKELIEIPHCTFVEIYSYLVKKFNATPLTWNGHKACVCLTHDVDSKEGYRFIENILDLEKRFKARSTYNFLTNWGYRIDSHLVKKILEAKFEVGLHGWTHDIALGCRDKKRIKRELGLAMKELGVRVSGFRAPAFAISKALLEVLVELGIKYDSSMKTLSCYGQAVESPYPYRYPGVDIWEIPLTIQDDRIFRDLHLSCEEGLGVIKELVERIIKVGGVVVINTHPRLIKSRYIFYEDFLAWLSEQPDILVCPTIEVIDICEQRREEFNRCLSIKK
ncbi:MAG: polysaccharide deacetylase family protein [Candidatus Omnitrophota bacterium]